MENQVVLKKSQEAAIKIYIDDLKQSPTSFYQKIYNINNIFDISKIERVPISFLKNEVERIVLEAFFLKLVIDFINCFNCKNNLTENQIKIIVKEFIDNEMYSFFSIEDIAYSLNRMKTGGAISFLVFDHIDVNNILQGLRSELYYLVDFIVNQKISLINKRANYIKKQLKNE